MAKETPRDDAETTYIALTKRLEEQYIENLAFVEARGGIGENGATVRDAFLDAADAVARLSPDQLAARVASCGLLVLFDPAVRQRLGP